MKEWKTRCRVGGGFAARRSIVDPADALCGQLAVPSFQCRKSDQRAGHRAPRDVAQRAGCGPGKPRPRHIEASESETERSNASLLAAEVIEPANTGNVSLHVNGSERRR